jgi:UDP-glucose 4-epimerase
MNRDCLNPYSLTKVAGEDMIKMYADLYNMDAIIFRYFNVYGERQPTKGQYAPVVGLFQKLKKNKKKLTVVGDGLALRDYTYVKDVVDANILAMRNNISGCEVFNIGTGKNYSVLDLAKMIGGEIEYIPPRKGEAKETLANISKAKNKLGWRPKMNLKKWINDN